MSSGSLLKPEDRVLPTLNADGSRRWLTPKVVPGPYRSWRKAVGWALIAVFVALPHIHVDGRQAFFINIADGEFTLFGATFLRTDTLLLALSVVSIFVTIFLATALLGRVWCGWACPQTVYLEFVFRPLDRLFDGKATGKGLHGAISALPGPARGLLRWSIMLAICFVLANTFLGYFVGSRPLLTWITNWPWVHPMGFGVVAFVTVLMMIDFGFYREQLCFVACPYGRMQSVLLDQRSLIVGYDTKRGEPRGKARRAAGGDLSLPQVGAALGDCVDCTKCVQVCPSGIDIREGLQLECIHCTACMDACDDVMLKLGRPRGLIRYTSQEALQTGTRKMVRPRVFVYPGILAALLTVVAVLLVTKRDAEVMLIRAPGLPFNTLTAAEISNPVRVRITNRTREPRTFSVTAEDGLAVRGCEDGITVGGGATTSESVLLVAEPEFFAGTGGHRRVKVTVSDNAAFSTTRVYQLMGPAAAGVGQGVGP